MLIHKSHSKTDLIDLINHVNLKVVFSHQDNKRNIQDKLYELLETQFAIEKNFYNIDNKDGLIQYLTNQNPKKTLTIKQKNDVMMICKHIIQYCKNNYEISHTKYDTMKDLQDDMDYIKQFGDIPSVRRCCRLMNEDIKMNGIKFNPLISPQVKKDLEEKKTMKKNYVIPLTINHATEDNPIILYFD